MVGRWVYRVAVGWLTWELTESTSWLGILALADTFPMVVLSVIAGAIGTLVWIWAQRLGTELAEGLEAAGQDGK